MDSFIGACIAVAVLVVMLFAAHSFGRVSVIDDCNNYGKAKIETRMIECKVQP